jgi:hypothetical protein
MHLDSLDTQTHVRANGRLKSLASQNPVSANFDRRDADDFVSATIEARCLAIDRDNLISGATFE